MTKVDESGGDTLLVSAPDIDGVAQQFTELCVKAGDYDAETRPLDGVYIIKLSAPVTSWTIDHPTKDSISHWGYKSEPVPPVVTTDNAYWCDGTTAKSASRTVTDSVPGSWSPETPPEGYASTPQTCGGGSPDPDPTFFSAPGGSDVYCSASGTTVTVAWDGVSGQATQDQANEGAAFNKNTALQANGVPFGTNPGACAAATVAAAEPATVTAPLPATVASPAKKPVAAPKPAKVTGGVVDVPQAATVPAAVPAGGGSQAPGLPMWALGLIAVGALGAAAAGRQLIGARK